MIISFGQSALDDMSLILGLLLTAVLAPGCMLLKSIEVRVPASVLLGSSAQLSCHWKMDPSEVLYSVKWYKDDNEFFRYVPNDLNPIRTFPLTAVEVENYDSTGSNLTLASVSLKTSGRYSCEVSGEKPLFQTVMAHAAMDVIVLPDHGPVISGVRHRYAVGNRLMVNCTCGRSHPATDLSWYINDGDGESVLADALQLQEHKKYEDGLEVTFTWLDLVVTDKFFKNNKLKIKCLATIPPFYWKSVEEESVKKRSNIEIHTEATEVRNNTRDILEVRGRQLDTNSSYQSKNLPPNLLLLVVFCYLVNLIYSI